MDQSTETPFKLHSGFKTGPLTDVYVYWTVEDDLMVRVETAKGWPAPGQRRLASVSTRLDIGDRPWSPVELTDEILACGTTREIAALLIGRRLSG